jgi:TPR repeat protein
MDSEPYLKVFELEREGKPEEGLRLLRSLAENDDPLALIELGTSHISTEGQSPPVSPIPSDTGVGKELIERGKRVLEEKAGKGDGEAMRMLGYLYLGLIGIHEKNIKEAETQLLNSYNAGCYFAANDLYAFYLGSNLEKSKHYYKEAERHHCRVVYHEDFET